MGNVTTPTALINLVMTLLNPKTEFNKPAKHFENAPKPPQMQNTTKADAVETIQPGLGNNLPVCGTVPQGGARQNLGGISLSTGKAAWGSGIQSHHP